MISQVDKGNVTSRLDIIIKKNSKIFSNFFPSTVIFLVKFDPKVNKKVNYEKKLKMTTKKYIFENSETSFVHQICVFY